MSRDRGADPSDVNTTVRTKGWLKQALAQQAMLTKQDLDLFQTFHPGNALECFTNAPPGTVIRWFERAYLYVAVKTGAGWYTSATEKNTFVGQVMDDYQMANMLGQQVFLVATDWAELNVPPF